MNGGNRAAVVRYRFDERTIHRPGEIRWWDWEVEKITRNFKTICDGDVAALENTR